MFVRGITEWSVKWHRHGWHVKSKQLGHRDKWETIFKLRREAGSLSQFVWTPSHMKVKGNNMADSLAKEGRLQHPHNKKRRSAEPQPGQLWEGVGLCPMRSDVSSSSGVGSTEPCVSVGEQSSVGGSQTSTDTSEVSTDSLTSDGASDSSAGSSSFGTDASDRQRERKRAMQGRGQLNSPEHVT